MPVIGRGRGRFVPKGKLFSTGAGITTRDQAPSGARSNGTSDPWKSANGGGSATTTDAWGTVHNDSNTDRFADPDREVEIKFNVLNSNLPRIIGKGGSNIQNMQAESSAEINIEKREADNVKTPVTLKGSQLNCDHAKKLIDEICMKFNGMCDDAGVSSRGGFNGAVADGPSSDEDIWIPADKAGRVIGRSGSKIAEIQDDSGCNVKVHRKENDDDEKVMVTLSGSDGQRAKARGIIEELTAERGGGGGGGFTMPSDAEPLEIWVETCRLGRVVGKKGAKIREIQDTFCVRVDIQKDDIKDDDTKVILTGSPASTAQAKDHIDELTERSMKPESSSYGDGGGGGDSNWDTSGGAGSGWGQPASASDSGWGQPAASTGNGDGSGWGPSTGEAAW